MVRAGRASGRGRVLRTKGDPSQIKASQTDLRSSPEAWRSTCLSAPPHLRRGVGAPPRQRPRPRPQHVPVSVVQRRHLAAARRHHDGAPAGMSMAQRAQVVASSIPWFPRTERAGRVPHSAPQQCQGNEPSRLQALAGSHATKRAHLPPWWARARRPSPRNTPVRAPPTLPHLTRPRRSSKCTCKARPPRLQPARTSPQRATTQAAPEAARAAHPLPPGTGRNRRTCSCLRPTRTSPATGHNASRT